MKQINAIAILYLCAVLCGASEHEIQNNSVTASNEPIDPVIESDGVCESEQQTGYPEEEGVHQEYVYTDSQEYGWTPLTYSIAMGDGKTAEELIQNGTDINEIDGYFRSPLYVSILHGHQHIAKLLVESGANLNTVVPGYGYTPLQLSLLMANSSTIAELLIKHGADVNIASTDSMTPLQRSIQMRNEKIAKLIIENGADINAKDNEARTALHYSILYGSDAIAKLLIESGADVNVVDSQHGYTPLHLTIMMQNGLEIAEFLIKHGADLKMASNDGMTPLHRSIQMGKETIAEELIKSGKVDINSVDNYGRTALYLSIQHSSEKIAKLLIESGADVNVAEQINGWTPIHLAAAMKTGLKFSELLMNNNADLNILTKIGEKPETLAELYGDEKTLNLLKQKREGGKNAI